VDEQAENPGASNEDYEVPPSLGGLSSSGSRRTQRN
jgi:hypothetical protein